MGCRETEVVDDERGYILIVYSNLSQDRLLCSSGELAFELSDVEVYLRLVDHEFSSLMELKNAPFDIALWHRGMESPVPYTALPGLFLIEFQPNQFCEFGHLFPSSGHTFLIFIP